MAERSLGVCRIKNAAGSFERVARSSLASAGGQFNALAGVGAEEMVLFTPS